MATTEWWQSKSLHELDKVEWEALCDGCGKCCLHKLSVEEAGEPHYTRIHCRLLTEDCRCSDYTHRLAQVPECLDVQRLTQAQLDWLPSTCAYRLRASNRPLPDWHPLVSGSPDSVHRAGMSVRGRVVSEEFVHPDGFGEHIVHWVD
ncbi:MAG: YcgN family cysteine cluster protein [Pseudomonadota bacterium]